MILLSLCKEKYHVMTAFSDNEFQTLLKKLRSERPLVHVLTNDVVQEITADVLLAAGASPAMVVAPEEAGIFAGVAHAVLINIGTPTMERIRSMHLAADACAAQHKPWVLDPVAAGGIPWRDEVIRSFVAKRPTVIRGNASEIRALAGFSSSGKGVDSCDSSDDALEAAQLLARNTPTVVHVTGAVDYVTDGSRTVAIPGGHSMATLVVGTGCSLSALVAAFAAVTNDAVAAAAAAATLAKRAGDYAAKRAKAPGSFHVAYIDGLYWTGRSDETA